MQCFPFIAHTNF